MAFSLGDFLQGIGRLAKVPLGASQGFSAGLQKWVDPSLDPENRLGFGNPLSGLALGTKNNLSASQAADYLGGDYDTSDDSGFKRALGVGINVGADPLTWAGFLGPGIRGVAGGTALGSKLAGAAEGAGSLTNVEKSAPFINKAAQFARRVNTGESIIPGGGLIYAGAARKLEPMAARSKVLEKLIAARTGTPGISAAGAVDEVGNVADVAEETVAPVARRIMPGAGRPPVRQQVQTDLADLASKATPPQTNGQKMIAELMARKKGGAPTPQQEALEKVVRAKASNDFDAWRQATVGPFTNTSASEQLTPEEIMFFMQNYGG